MRVIFTKVYSSFPLYMQGWLKRVTHSTGARVRTTDIRFFVHMKSASLSSANCLIRSEERTHTVVQYFSAKDRCTTQARIHVVHIYGRFPTICFVLFYDAHRVCNVHATIDLSRKAHSTTILSLRMHTWYSNFCKY